MRDLLIVFYHFAPINVSGLQRVLHFLRHLPARGWRGHVLGVDPATAEPFLARDEALLARVPEGTQVFRAPRAGLLDALVRRLPSGTEVPDMQVGWYGPAVRAGRAAIERLRPAAVLASGSPWTALLVGRRLARAAGLPFVADFRDPWVGNPYLRAGRVRAAVERALEAAVVRAADAVIANTEPLRHDFRWRYPAIDGERFTCIPNGYDAAELEGALADAAVAAARAPGALVLRHVGGLYAKRDPRPLLRAAAAALARGEIPRGELTIELIGENDFPDAADPAALEALGLAGAVRFLPPVPHREAIRAAATADAVLIVQPDTAFQVPAKLFEAIGLGRPVLCLAPEGATASIVREERAGRVVPPGDEDAIRRELVRLWREKREVRGRARPRRAAGGRYDAPARARALAEALDAAVKRRAAAAGAGEAKRTEALAAGG